MIFNDFQKLLPVLKWHKLAGVSLQVLWEVGRYRRNLEISSSRFPSNLRVTYKSSCLRLNYGGGAAPSACPLKYLHIPVFNHYPLNAVHFNLWPPLKVSYTLLQCSSRKHCINKIWISVLYVSCNYPPQQKTICHI